MTRAIHTRSIFAIATTLLMFGATAQAADPNSVWDGAYNAAQVKRGSAIYTKICETCHGPTLNGGEAPPLAGADFLANWSGYTAGDLLEKMRSTMPQTDPGSLSLQQYVDVLAVILSANKFPAGDAELAAVPDRLKKIRFEPIKPAAK